MDLILTKAEAKAMKILWSIKKGLIRDVVNEYDDPKPAYTTVATIFKILEKKGFVGYKAYGKTHEYYPLIAKEKYTKFYLNNMISGYFNGSFQNLVSFFAKEEKLDLQDIDTLMKKLEELKKQKP